MIRISAPRPSPLRRLADLGLGIVVGVAAAIAVMSARGPSSAEATAGEAAAAVTGLVGQGSAGLSARALSVIDGDTFEARVATFPGQEIVTRVRIAGLDAPERAGRCAGETAAAGAATAALSGLIEGRRLTLSAVKGDKYFGRVVARVSTQDGDVARALIADGHGRAYSGGKRSGWC